jgi:glycosyltransferase involved in cell wall biosynthesis
MRRIAGQLADRGHRVVLLVDGRRVDLVDPAGNPAIYTWPSFRPREPHFQDAQFLYRLIRQYRPDCLIAEYSSIRLMSLLGWLARVPQRVVWYQTMLVAIERDVPMSAIRRLPTRLIDYLARQLATWLVVVSRAAQADAVRAFHVAPEKCRLFYNSISDPLNPSDMLSSPTPRSRRLICAGRLQPNKGQAVLIQALALLKDLPPFQVEFIGEGPLNSAYQQLARDLDVDQSCLFLGHLPYLQVLRHMADSLVTVVPSQDEAFGNVLIESFSVGTPVVASRVGGIIEIVRDGLDGCLVSAGDPSALAEALRSLFLNRNLWETMSRNARQRFLENFEASAQLPQITQWLEEICVQSYAHLNHHR